MPKTFTLNDSIHIQAPIERCFLLSINLEVVRQELGMRAIAGARHGLASPGDRILWRGWKFGLPHHHESLISAWNPPTFFQDTMLCGRFASFQHDHRLTPTPTGTLLEDELRFSLPFAGAGALVARWIMVPYIARLMRRRFTLLKTLAEGDGWRALIPEHPAPEATPANEHLAPTS